MIPEETIVRVRESINLVELVRESVPGLKKSGRNYQARCPFHQERTPSFHVNPEMGLFKCFGCGVGGDAFKFVMLTEGLNYPEAIRKLANRVGLSIEEAQAPALSAQARERETLYGLLENAARFYHRHLMESQEAKPARDYLERRGLIRDTFVRFQIGYAPTSGQALREAASRKGWSIDILEKGGLLRRKEDSERIFDHFWNRIMFPIWDAQGRIVAFGGRTLGEALPKYINSPETPIYSKSRHLYGLFQGLPTLRKRRQIVILEGYMDVLACHQHHFDYSAATLGTALTEDHVRLIRRYAEKVTLLFDPDAAGAKATLRGGELLLEEGFSIDVVHLPGGLDPDEILLREGKETFEACLKTAVPFLEYCLSEALKEHSIQHPEGKLAVAKAILPLIRKVRDPLLQDEYLKQLADALQVDKEVLGRQMKLLKTETRSSSSGAGASSAAPLPEKPSGLLSLEEEILLLALLHPSAEIYRSLAALSWQDPRCQQVWEGVGTSIQKGTFQLSEASSQLPEPVRDWLTALVFQQRAYPRPVDMLQEFLEAWRKQQDAAALVRLQPEINSMIEGRIPMDSQKVQVYNDLSRRLKGSKSTLSTEAPLHG